MTWDNQREKLATGVRCQPAYFDAAAKPGCTIAKGEPGYSDPNIRLTTLVAELSDLFTKASAHRVPAREQVLALVAKPDKAVAAPAPKDPLLTDLLARWGKEHPQSSAAGKRRWR